MTAGIVRNDWSGITVPPLGQWRPTMTVSVVIPAYGGQAQLDLVLAALSRQTYPAELLEVIVVDDGSPQPLELPPVRPARIRLLRAAADTWGPAGAVHIGVLASSGEVVLRLDADMLVYAEHVAAHARWHHAVPYAVTLGHKRFVDVAPGAPGWPSVEDVTDRGAAALYDEAGSEPHDYIEEILRRSADLRTADHTVFMAHVGATAAMRRELYDAAGGYDRHLHLGEDTEFGYRLAQAGALFVPEPAAGAWHLGRSAMMKRAVALRRYNRPFLADRMPQPGWLRKHGGTAWTVPLVRVVVDVNDQPSERVRSSVDALLRGDEQDLRITLVGPWDRIKPGRRDVLADAWLEPRLIQATYQGDTRVDFATEAPVTAFPAPFLLTVPPTVRVVATTVARMLAEADRHQSGLVRVETSAGPVELWRTAAVARARWQPDSVEAAGITTLSAADAGVQDVAGVPLDLLGEHPDAVAQRSGRWLPASVEVAGVRTLAQATGLVARLTVHRLAHRLRQLIARPDRIEGRRG